MQTQNKMIQELVQYLADTLLCSPLWTNPTPRTFLYQSDKDREVIYVYVSDYNITILHDGKNVVDGMEMIRLGSLKHLENDIELREKVFSAYLNTIVSCR